MKKSFEAFYVKAVSRFKSYSYQPKDIDLNVSDILGCQRIYSVAIIDDNPFPWIDALEHRKSKVKYFPDFVKQQKRDTKRPREIDFSSYDIVLCDIHGVGQTVYPGIDGIGVIEELRKNNPLQMIVAYTGDPGILYKKLKKQSTVDFVFCRDWEIDDFLLNFQECCKAFEAPDARWKFIKNRLEHLEVDDATIAKIRRAFSERCISAKMLNQKFNFSISETRLIINKGIEKDVNIPQIVNAGIPIAKLALLLNPFDTGSN